MSASPAAIPFSRPPLTGREQALVAEVVASRALTDGKFSRLCREWLEQRHAGASALMTPSCTHALEMAALLLNIQPGDEIIMPSFTFVSTANAFALRGGVPVFVDIRPDTLNIDETLVEPAITPRTRALVAMHYAGVACDMDALTALAKRRNLPLVEDAAHALTAKWRGRLLGTFGDMATLSFHATKNLSAGEGGALLLNRPEYAPRAAALRAKGTNREQFMQGSAPHYTWVDVGSSWAMGEMSAAYLYGNMEAEKDIHAARHALWDYYARNLKGLEKQGDITLPVVPEGCEHNAHIFHIRLENEETRKKFIAHMRARDIGAVFHYVPLHSSPAGKKYGRFHGADRYTTTESARLVRLPLFYGMTQQQAARVVDAIQDFYARG